MGYDLHITRAEHWVENDGQWIEADEWLALVESDPELRLDENNGPYFVIWSGPSKYEEPWFDWSDGNITTKYPDSAMITKMVEIAGKLGGNVQGDDGERYVGGKLSREFDAAYFSDDVPKSWWRRLLGW